MPLNESRSYRWTIRLWPEAAQMDEGRQFRAVETIVQMLVLLPFAVAGLILLAVRTDYNLLQENLTAVLILFVAMFLLLLQPFNIQIQLRDVVSDLRITGSLAPLVMWSALFISGAAGMWALVLAAIFTALWQGVQLRRYGQNPIWEPLATFGQLMGLYLLATIIAGLTYLAAGGSFPIVADVQDDWVLAILTIIAGVLLTGLLMLPVVVQVNRLKGMGNTLGRLAISYLAVVALPLIMGPFAIIVAILNVEGRTVALVVALIGIYLVNRLAHHMSVANQRSRRQANEFAQLEAMGQALIEAPADASTLPEVLRVFLPRLFPVEMAAVHVFETDGRGAWSSFHLALPEGAMAADETSVWQVMQRSTANHVVLRDTRLAGDGSIYGDGLAAKIMLEQSGAGGGTKTSCVGGVYLLRHHAVGRTLDSLAAVQSLASQVASALYRAEAHAELLAFHKAQQELEFAGRVQQSFLPTSVPEAESWQISAVLDSARQTSGDYYDFIPLDEGLIGIVVADVSDKGTGAALYMALSRTLIRTYAMESGGRPEVAVQRANERILGDTDTAQFVTGIYGILDVRTGVLTYANAGHNPGYLLKANGETVEHLGNTGIPLGMFPGLAWTRAEAQIEPGDMLLLYTDGVPEAQNEAQEEYGDARFLEVARANAGKPAEEIQQAVLRDVEAFVGDAAQFDDITLMVIIRDE